LQGRVNSVFRLIVFGGDPLGYALTGLLLQSVGAIPTILVYGTGLGIVAIAATLNTHIRNIPPLATVRALEEDRK
jgi:hypothetical protein